MTRFSPYNLKNVIVTLGMLSILILFSRYCRLLSREQLIEVNTDKTKGNV